MNVVRAMREAPDVLRRAIALGAAYEKVIRRAGWAEGLVTLVGGGTAVHAAEAGALALELLLGWPARARQARDFHACSLPTLRPRSIVIAMSTSGEDESVTEVAAQASRQGANVLALTANLESPLAKSAREVLPLAAVDSEYECVTRPLSEHTALLLVATIAAKIFNPRNPNLANLKFEELPDCAAEMAIHLSDPVDALARELKRCRLHLVGGGLYYPAALRAASLARRIAAPAVEALTLGDAEECGASGSDEAYLFLSGAKSKVKSALAAAAAQLKKGRARLFALTASGDQELTGHCRLALLMPALPEVTGSLASLTVLERLVLARRGAAEQSKTDISRV